LKHCVDIHRHDGAWCAACHLEVVIQDAKDICRIEQSLSIGAATYPCKGRIGHQTTVGATVTAHRIGDEARGSAALYVAVPCRKRIGLRHRSSDRSSEDRQDPAQFNQTSHHLLHSAYQTIEFAKDHWRVWFFANRVVALLIT
jgi:hypothetical protein